MSAADRARHVVVDWTLLLVRGLPDSLARDRSDEVVSDLWEHQHDASVRGRTPSGIAAAIMLRALRGLPADLQWRWTAGRRATLRIEGITMAKKPNPVAKQWVHLIGPDKPFDQTNGIIEFDVEGSRDDSDDVRGLLEKAAIANWINVGGGGGI